MTPLALERDSRTLKQAASFLRLGYRSIVVEGESSELDPGELPLELVSIPRAERPWGAAEASAEGAAGTVPVAADPAAEGTPEGPTALHARIWSTLVSLSWRVRGPAQNRWYLLRQHASWNARTHRVLPPADLYVLHSYTQFPAVLLRCLRHRARFAYDAHDAYFDLSPATKTWQGTWAAIERCCVRGAQGFMTVSRGLADVLERRHHRRAVVLRNCHDQRLDQAASQDLRARLGLDGEAFLLVSVGNQKPGMTVEPALRSLALLPEHVHLAFVGRGFEQAAEMARELGVAERAHFPGPVPPAEVVSFISSADAAAVLYRPLSDNYLYALPNGFFQSLAAGLPLLYPPGLPEVRAVAERRELGLPIDPTSPDSIAAAARELLDDPEKRAGFRKNAESARERESWEREEQLLAGYVGSILERGASSAATTDGATP